jgi:ribonuclease BN (tRNA processing enzyme)
MLSVNEGGMEIEVLGVGNAFTALHYQTSFLVKRNRNYLIDGPQCLFRLLRERAIPRESIDDVIITHIHGDHVSGLETLLLWKKYFEAKKVRLHTSRLVYQALEEHFFSSFSRGFSSDFKSIVSKQFGDYVEFLELTEDRAIELEPGLALEIRHNWHPTPTLGLRFTCRGRSISISGDTCYRPALLKELFDSGILREARYHQLRGDWLWNADVIYHEVDGDPDGSHTFVGDLLALPAETLKKIRLVHIPDEFETRELPIAEEGERILINSEGRISLEAPGLGG